MWICIMGAPSTGKETIALLLKNLGYDRIVVKVPNEPDDSHFLIARMVEQLKAQKIMFEQNVFTFRTIWDTFEVMTRCSLETDVITQEQFSQVENIYRLFDDQKLIQPPNLVIFTRMEKRDVQNRTLLQGRQPDDRHINKQLELYEEFIARVRVPKIEINMSNSPQAISEELNYGIDSVKSMVLTQKTIWDRSMFF
jgi:hypothetical protein